MFQPRLLNQISKICPHQEKPIYMTKIRNIHVGMSSLALNVWLTLIFTILQTHKDLVASDFIRQRVNTRTADA